MRDMAMRPFSTSDRGEFRVDYEPHRVRVAGGRPKDIDIAPRPAAPVYDGAEVEIIDTEVVSETVGPPSQF